MVVFMTSTETQVFSFDVTVSTHDLLKRGITAGRFVGAPAHHHRIVVSASSFLDAHLIAAQMASLHGVVTGVFVRI
jgi:hypothetical protein